MATPTTDADAATKKYIDDHVTNVHQTGYLKKDSSVAMTGDLNVGNHEITNVATLQHRPAQRLRNTLTMD